MIEHENDPVWTPLDPQSGHASWAPRCRMSMAEARTCAVTGSPAWPVARWDAEALTWVVAPPAPVEVTGVPSRWVTIDAEGRTYGSHPTEAEAWADADSLSMNPANALPIRVEACIPVPRNEANDG